LESLSPSVVLEGSFRLGERTIDVDGWPGMVGHNWGTQHAERWIWLQAIFDEGSWLDVALGRIRVAGRTLPWIGNGAVSLDGHRYRVGGLSGVRKTEVSDGYMECRFSLPGDVPLRGTVTREPRSTIAWPYADPDGSLHQSLNSSIAAVTIKAGPRELSTEHGGVYELGVKETDHGVPVAPFSDG
jgi:hypothetical protein